MNGSDPHEYYTGGAHPAGHTVAGMMILCDYEDLYFLYY